MIDPLTERELQVLMMVADGYSNDEMATECFLAVNTIKTHVTHVKQKLEAKNKAHAVAIAYHHGILTPMRLGND
jgi:DNA-binding CsgD family transcriptional regulator